MDKNRIRELIERFNKNELSQTDLDELEGLVASGSVRVSDLPEIGELHDRIVTLEVPDAGERMDQAFYGMLERAISGQRSRILNTRPGWIGKIWPDTPLLRIAYTLILLLSGLAAGIIIDTSQSNRKIDALSNEISQMQNTMMLALVNETSATERLRAIGLTSRINDADDKVIDALLNTLNHDENANVRLAAINALLKYSDHEKVRTGMIRSISDQQWPIVQTAIADAMVLMQEKRAVGNLKDLLENNETNILVKKKLQKSINKLI